MTIGDMAERPRTLRELCVAAINVAGNDAAISLQAHDVIDLIDAVEWHKGEAQQAQNRSEALMAENDDLRAVLFEERGAVARVAQLEAALREIASGEGVSSSGVAMQLARVALEAK